MKIRKGFVSNSSSTSFVVAFPHKPVDKEDLAYMMRNGKHLISNKDVDEVWREAKYALDHPEWVGNPAQASNPDPEHMPLPQGFVTTTGTIDWDAYHEAFNKWFCDGFDLQEKLTKSLYLMSFSWENDEMEEGSQFLNLPHVKEDNH
jgi:hypothetical protein